MAYLVDLSPIQERIVKKICYTQLSSLRRLYNNRPVGSLDMILLLADHNITQEQYNQALEERIELFKALGKNPNKVMELKHEDLSIFKHILVQIEASYREAMPQAVERLWDMLFALDEYKEHYNLN